MLVFWHCRQYEEVFAALFAAASALTAAVAALAAAVGSEVVVVAAAVIPTLIAPTRMSEMRSNVITENFICFLVVTVSHLKPLRFL